MAVARAQASAPTEVIELDAHINDSAFSDAALAVFDRWVATGIVVAGATPVLPP
jgi:uncharacterized protein (UPF0261 family)